MWLIIRMVMIFVGLGWRFKDWFFLPEPLTHGNELYYLKKNKTRAGYDSMKIGVKFDSDVHFSFTRENKFNLLFKIKGFHSEFQTGDADFDRMVYIASDHPMLHDLLKNSQTLRREITRLFSLGYATIWNENKVLWTCVNSPRSDAPDIVLDSLMELRKALLKLNPQRAKMFFDKFYHRALMIEAAVWTIAG